MKHHLATLALLVLSGSAGAQVGQQAKLDVVEWYNSPPISAEQLRGHTVMVEVFRTW
jgi:hypothetical protein